MVLNYGDLIVCLDKSSPYFLKVGVVSDKIIKDFDGVFILVSYENNTTVEYERWRMSGHFKRILSETIVG